ncbi:DHA2 family efflux MFS transporter permease subunit [Legionella oakridgensis]|uniref:Drug resistance transporter, EmrB/QacA subfamily n=2 Tax=Legionella oakridgensis TaxID=29423 RepID=W0BAP6_9GAMM|nr:DHA2 family efflux MFS transporter permease subunit [Legionella oakridgensis]AHE66915.1 drug resistance transporter, EmrB/QacA subfamily [Legionella oakridgensis ATCC 33761 = DSM 21215]KTD37163.1 multidrug efflux protein [Legionella oakridgensis]STY20021.1 multidrug efflux protein [Legionella longbeachae]
MKKNIILFIVSFAMFMETVDTTIINTAVPMMARSLNVNPIDLKLALISYLVSLAIFIPISGWIADKYGVKKIFIAAISIFTLSSIWCGFSHSLSELIIARFIQGLGGSLTLPVGRLIIVRTCERHELVAKMSIVVIVAAVGMMMGPVLGGIITNYFSWRWIFWVNVPVGFLAIFLSIYLLPVMPALPVHALDKFGFILFGSGLALLTYGLSILSESEVQDVHSILIIGISCLLLIFYIWHSHRQQHPIVRIELLHSRTFRVSVMGNLLARLGFGGLPFLLPLLLQIGLGFSPQLSGLLLAPTALGVILVKPLSVSILRFLGYKKLLILNTILVSLVLSIFSLIDQFSSIYSIGFLTFIYGFLISLQYTGMNSLAYANISHEDLSAATSIMSTIQQLAQSFGVAAAAILVKLFSIKFPNHLSLSIHTFHQVFIAIGILTLLSTIVFMHLKKEDGQELITMPAS